MSRNTGSYDKTQLPGDTKSSLAKTNYQLRMSKVRTLLEIGSLKCVIEPRRPYIPLNPWKSPHFFPQKPMAQYVTPAFFLKLPEDTLFFIFYAFPNTLQQQMAARELKRMSWRLHKKYYSWYQRNDKPFRVTETYERGSFVYFDQDDWRKVVKHDFTLYYSLLDR